MNKNTFTAVKLSKGEVNVYDFGTVKLHAYKTNDFIDNEVFIVEKAGKAVILESPCFFDNIEELTAYLNGVEVAGMLVAYMVPVQRSCRMCRSMPHRTLWNTPKTAAARHLSPISQTHSEQFLITPYTRSPT